MRGAVAGQVEIWRKTLSSCDGRLGGDFPLDR